MYVIRKHHFYHYLVPLEKEDEFITWCQNKDDIDFWYQNEDPFFDTRFTPLDFEDLIIEKCRLITSSE